jgi:hypothetical protein
MKALPMPHVSRTFIILLWAALAMALALGCPKQLGGHGENRTERAAPVDEVTARP